ncbi:MAG: hypothetical protein GY938_11010 [Ketobacter sp.]|nr:hypothetical protein [Ketobacter sp.]
MSTQRSDTNAPALSEASEAANKIVQYLKRLSRDQQSGLSEQASELLPLAAVLNAELGKLVEL